MPDEDALAFFREAGDFRNVRMAEVANGDFAEAITRVLLFATARLAVFARLTQSRDHVLAAVAAKGVKELAYHRDYAGRWFLTLAQGTDESRRRLLAALDALWPLYPELLAPHAGRRRGSPRPASASTRRRSSPRSTWCSSRCSPRAASTGPSAARSPACRAAPVATGCTPRS